MSFKDKAKNAAQQGMAKAQPAAERGMAKAQTAAEHARVKAQEGVEEVELKTELAKAYWDIGHKAYELASRGAISSPELGPLVQQISVLEAREGSVGGSG